jgi:hypothetical protein
MKNPINDDNRYKVGEIVTAYANPAQQLKIVDYKERIYYCQAPNDVEKTLAYFEREIALIKP